MTFSPGLIRLVTSSVMYWTVSFYSVKPGFRRPLGSGFEPLSVISFQPRPDEYTRAETTAPCSVPTVNDLRSITAGRTGLQAPAFGEPAAGRQMSAGTGPTTAALAACAFVRASVSVMPLPSELTAVPPAWLDASAGLKVTPVPRPRVAALAPCALPSGAVSVIPVPL